MSAHSSLPGRKPVRLVPWAMIPWGIAVLLVLAGLVVFVINERNYTRTMNEAARLQRQASNLNQAIITEVLSARSYLIAGEIEDITSRTLANQETRSWFRVVEEGLPAGSEAAVHLRELEALHEQYNTLAVELLNLSRAGKSAEAEQLFDDRSDPLVTRLVRAGQILQEDLDASFLQAGRDFSTAVGLSSGLIALAVLVILLTGSLGVLRQTVPQPFKPSNPRPLSSQILFVDRLGHDMNAVLSAIIGYSGLLAEADLYTDVASIQTFGKIISRQSLRLEKMITDARLATRIVEGRLDLTLTFVRIHPLLAALADEAGRQSERPVCFSSSMETAVVLGDSLRLREAFARIIDNALKFSPENTPVTISLARVVQQPGWIEIRVQDQGMGIDPSEQSKLFQPFGRAAGEEARRVQGAGLGLYIARSVFKAHEGSIALESEPGRGACAVIRLPLAEMEP